MLDANKKERVADNRRIREMRNDAGVL